ncbi:MAG: DUF4350 domain-containing protein [Bacteroidota bacterium]
MSNNKNIIIVAIVAIGLLILMYFMFGNGSKRYSWWEHYNPKKESPYGTSIVHALMKEYLPEKNLQIIRDSLHQYLLDKKTEGSYFYLGPALWLDSIRIHAMLDFVKRGNDAIIISQDIAFELLDSISQRDCIDLTYERDSTYYDYFPDYYFEDTLATLNFDHKAFKTENGYQYNFRHRTIDEYYSWDYLPPELFCEYQTEFTTLGTINDTLVNFAKAKYGDGHFYLHTTPLAFTNFHIIKKDGRQYAEKALSHLNKSPVLWDATTRSFEFSGRNRSFNKSPLKYILSQPPLAWGWYILLGMAVLYLIFRAKRRQRIIPVLEKNENTSLEFINTIGRLYFIQNNHRQLALEKMNLFLGFIREHYKLPTREINDAFKKQLSLKSEIPLNTIEKIFTIHTNILQSKFTSENTLVNFHREMEGFYMHCK